MTKRLIVTVAALLALGVFVSACGEDEEQASAGGSTTEQQAQETQPAEPAQKDIVGVAQGEPQLSTLVKAVTAADLVKTLQGEGPFTVFAPTNDAFDALGDQQLQELLEPANKEQLADILTYHVVPGKVTSSQLRDGQEVKTVQGETLRVSISGSTVKINDATVAQPDVEAENGVVHVIDGVLTPGG